jgi:adenine-specific DNA-methyltransferase
LNKKENGSFYTPSDIADWIVKKCLKKSIEKENIDVLEPSFGGGVFINSLLAQRQCLTTIDAVEYDLKAFNKLSFSENTNVQLFNEDFLFWESNKKYDVVLGNPPFIVKKTLKKEQSVQGKKIQIEAGLKDKEIANIWTPFLIKSAKLLNKTGVIGFVLPTELLQVNYAKEIRDFLLDNFKRVEVISFVNLAFADIEQDTVILIAYKDESVTKGLYFSEVKSIKELISGDINFEKHHGDHDSKWTSYILSENEIRFIKDIAKKCSKVSDLCTSVAGIVTAANKFFIVSKNDLEKFNLKPYVKKIIQKGLYVNGSLELLNSDYEKLVVDNKPCYLLDLSNVESSTFSKGLVEYLKSGVAEEIPERYKCKLRGRWFDVPSIWKSEGFFFKRGHHYPKLLVNKANVHVTDSAYRIKMHDGFSMESFTASFYNSLTLLCSELDGRFYGGGVLEITPNEFKNLPIPKFQVSSQEFLQFASGFKEKKSIDEFLKLNDPLILGQVNGIVEEDIDRLHKLYLKVKNRRLRKV